MKNKSIKNVIKFIVKLSLTAIALYFVFRKINVEKFYETIRNGNFFYLLLAILAFNLSKLISAFRLNNFFKAIGVHLSNRYNLRLYWVGMFYNLFLPGSIGGDGFKVYLISQFAKVKLKSLITAALLDRVSGMVFLVFIAIIMLLFSSLDAPIPHFNLLLITTLLLVIPVYYFVIRMLFPQFLKIFLVTGYQALLVQIGQVICAFFLLLSLHIEQNHFDYLALFMVSSIISVLPITIAGVGLREMVFLWGLKFLKVEEAASVAFTISFFIVTAFTSLIGLFFLPGIEKRTEANFPTEESSL